MPIRYKLDRRTGVAHVIIEGVVNLEEQLAHAERMLLDLEEFLPARVLSDRRSVGRFMDAGAIAGALEMLRRWGKARGGRLAFVVTHPEAIRLGTAFQGEAAMIGVEVRLFRSPEEALPWLEERPSPATEHR